MKKAIVLSAILSLGLMSVATTSYAISGAKVVRAEGETSEISSEAPAESSEGSELIYTIKEAHIEYRESASESYAPATSAVGFYYLSADGWAEEDTEAIVMTIKGSVTTKLEGKVVYIYEYRPSLVQWNGKELIEGEDKTYLLEKPSAPGAYDLSIFFTKEIIVNPMDLTSLNWSSFLTVQNLMTIGSWAIIVIGILFMYFLNLKYKRRGTTSVLEMKKQLMDYVTNELGKDTSKEIEKLLDVVIAKSFNEINGKLSSVDSNMTLLMRCLLLMQEDTPEARLAITDCLSKLEVVEDDKASEVSALIKNEMEKYKQEIENKQKALEEAKAANSAWKEKAEEPIEEAEDKEKDEDYGTL